MSLSDAQLQQHCHTIIKSRRIQGKIVILCEGGDQQALTQRPSPSAYRQLGKLPDANFYSACVPTWWKEGRPEFFVCGDKEDVLNTYFTLRQMHQDERSDSYLSKDKLFAIIDLDLQPPRPFADHPVSDTEELFKTLYRNNRLQLDNLRQNTIFITGLIYKEAYFLVPDLQPLFDHHFTVFYNDQPLNLDGLYQTMAQALSDDNNLCAHFPRACGRLNHLAALDFTNVATLQESWLQAFLSANEPEKSQLIYALLTIHQVKDYWKAFTPKDTIPEARFKEQLTLAIGGFYSRQPLDSEHHLPCFFKTLSTHTI